MTKEQKLAVHLDHIIFEDAGEGVPMTGKQVQALMDAATPEQHERAYQRALKHNPLLLDDEILQDTSR